MNTQIFCYKVIFSSIAEPYYFIASSVVEVVNHRIPSEFVSSVKSISCLGAVTKEHFDAIRDFLDYGEVS